MVTKEELTQRREMHQYSSAQTARNALPCHFLKDDAKNIDVRHHSRSIPAEWQHLNSNRNFETKMKLCFIIASNRHSRSFLTTNMA